MSGDGRGLFARPKVDRIVSPTVQYCLCGTLDYMRQLLIIPATALILTGCTSGPSQSDCYDAFADVLGPTIQAYANGADDTELDAVRAPIFEACGNVRHTVDGMKLYPEVVGLSDRAQVTPAALNTICYLRADTPACDGYADYDF